MRKETKTRILHWVLVPSIAPSIVLTVAGGIVYAAHLADLHDEGVRARNMEVQERAELDRRVAAMAQDLYRQSYDPELSLQEQESAAYAAWLHAEEYILGESKLAKRQRVHSKE